MQEPNACGPVSLGNSERVSRTHWPEACASIVVTSTHGAPASLLTRTVWITARLFSLSAARHASQHDARSAYLDLKKGLLESLSAPVIFPCAFDSAAASSLMFSEVSIYSSYSARKSLRLSASLAT